jgi:hypothetical protein
LLANPASLTAMSALHHPCRQQKIPLRPEASVGQRRFASSPYRALRAERNQPVSRRALSQVAYVCLPSTANIDGRSERLRY